MSGLKVSFVGPAQRIEIALVGAQGAAGTPASGGQRYEHVQSSASAEWIVNHNFGYRAIIEVLSPGGMTVVAEVIHSNDNQARIFFNTPQSGTALAR